MLCLHNSLTLFSISEAKLEKDLIKMAGNWHSSTKGTLVRKFRVPTLKEGKKLLNEISGLLSDDDMFRDAASHKVSISKIFNSWYFLGYLGIFF